MKFADLPLVEEVPSNSIGRCVAFKRGWEANAIDTLNNDIAGHLEGRGEPFCRRIQSGPDFVSYEVYWRRSPWRV